MRSATWIIVGALGRNRTCDQEMRSATWIIVGALGRNRTCDQEIRRLLLYPLSYEGVLQR
jgi:hypothetical protein